MPDEPVAPAADQKNKAQLARYALLAGAVIGALLARPVIRPWVAAHSELALHDWPLLASFVPWVLFSLYWEMEGRNSAPAASSESRASRAVHVVLANAALILIIVPLRGLNHRFIPDVLILKLAGLVIECAGLALAIWARRALGRNWSGEISIKQGHELVRNGPYAMVRHPIYTALLAMYLGTAIVSGQTHAVVGIALGVVAYLRKTRLEETNLVTAFGARYREYREDTWALLPGVY